MTYAMTWLKNFFSSKASGNPGESVTLQELGDSLFSLCLRHVASFLDELEHGALKKMEHIRRDEIDQIELLIAFMWSYFDLLQNEKYLDALTRMHGRFRQHTNNLNLDADKMWRLLQARYDEYRQGHRSEGTIDFTYKKVAWEIVKNVHNGPSVWLEFAVSISLQKQVQHIGEVIKNVSLSKG